MSVFPKNFKIPKESPYMTFQTGKNKFRILGDVITGWEGWEQVNGKGKPFRVHDDEKEKLIGKDNITYFIAFPVWNYDAKKIQVLEIKQKTIMNLLVGYEYNEDYGDLKGFDITVTKEGEGLSTKYTTMPSPPKAVSKEILDAYSEIDLDLNELYSGGDPFNPKSIDVNEILNNLP